LQAPLEERYRQAPDTAFVTLKAEGRPGEGVSCKVATSKATIGWVASRNGRDGIAGVFGADMLLEALVVYDHIFALLSLFEAAVRYGKGRAE
jgi:hypothetical protein